MLTSASNLPHLRILVCGSRDFANAAIMHQILYGICAENEVFIIEGGAKGADTIARRFAIANELPHETFHADWDKYGIRAGAIRNIEMLEVGKPDAVWAFVNKPIEQSKGTNHMVESARRYGVPVRVVECVGEAISVKIES